MSLSEATLALIDTAFAARDQAAQSSADAMKAAAAVIIAQTSADRASVLAKTDEQQAAAARTAALNAVEAELSAPPMAMSAKAKPQTMPAAA